MQDLLLAHEAVFRLTVFLAVFVAMASWEILAPRRRQARARTARWPNNMALVALDAVIVRILFPTTAVALALRGEVEGWGLLNLWQLPVWLALPVAVILLDFAIYLQHLLFHAAPTLWRLHRMHHADLAFDVTTGLRFHPIEILLSMAIKLAVITALGAPALAVLIFEVLLNASSMFNHSNITLSAAADRRLRWVVVTPDMHRVHHSIVRRETDSNFGFALSWWDRIFGTYRAQPAAGHRAMTLGIADFRDPGEQRLDRLLTQPFRRGDPRPVPAGRQAPSP